MDNRGRILESALQLFAARGYDAIGVQEICTAAGITKPTLYHYFGSKGGLLDALVQQRSAALLARLTAATAYAGDLPLSLREVIEVYFQFAMREPLFYRLLLALWLTIPANEAFHTVAALNEQQQQLVEALFIAAAADHGNMRGRHRTYAATFLGMINTYVSLSLNGYLELEHDIAVQAVHQFSHGIYS
jgi:TetR/AcrR family transcriptional regulator